MNPAPRTLLCFDFGAKRIGVALGEEVTRTARPLTTLANIGDYGPDWNAIEKLVAKWVPDALVVGLPVHMDGTEHAMTARARRFANRLHGRCQLPVHFADERYTSVAAERELAFEGHDPRDKAAIDARAARLILETWLAQAAANPQE